MGSVRHGLMGQGCIRRQLTVSLERASKQHPFMSLLQVLSQLPYSLSPVNPISPFLPPSWFWLMFYHRTCTVYTSV